MGDDDDERRRRSSTLRERERGFDVLAAVDRRGLQGPLPNHRTSRRQSQGCVRREGEREVGFSH